MKAFVYIFLGAALVLGVYYFFFSETAKKKSLIKQIKAKYNNPNDDPEQLMKLTVPQLTTMLQG